MAAALQSVTPNTRSKPGSKEQQQQQQQTKGASKDDSKSLDGKDKAGPVKQPDRAQLDEAVAVLEKDVTALAAKLDKVNASLAAIPSAADNNTSSNTAKSELAEVESKLRDLVGDQPQMRAKISQLETKIKQQRDLVVSPPGQAKYDNLGDIDAEIEKLQTEVDSQKMRLAAERQAIDTINMLKVRRPGFVAIADMVDQVAALKASLDTGKDSPEVASLRDRQVKLSDAVASANSKRESAQKRAHDLHDERRKVQSELRKKRAEMRDLKDRYHTEMRTYQAHADKMQRARRDRNQAERAVQEALQRVADAKAELADAKLPAFRDEIVAAEALIRILDPTAVVVGGSGNASVSGGESPAGGVGPGKASSPALPHQLRTVSEADIKGRKLVRREDQEDEWYVRTGSKKGSKRGGANASANASANVSGAGGRPASYALDVAVIQHFAKLDLNPPTSQAEVPAAVHALQQRIEWWTRNAADRTAAAVGKAEADIEAAEKAVSVAQAKVVSLVEAEKVKEGEKAKKGAGEV